MIDPSLLRSRSRVRRFPRWARWMLVILGAGSLGAAAGLGAAALTPAQYQATATLVVGTLTSVDPTEAEVLAATEAASTIAALATRGPRLQEVIDELELATSAELLDRDVYSRADPERPIVAITALAATPAEAAAIANGLARLAVDASANAGPSQSALRMADPAVAPAAPAWPTTPRYLIGGVIAAIVLGWFLLLRSTEGPTARSALPRPVPPGFTIGMVIAVALVGVLAVDAPDVVIAAVGGLGLLLALGSPSSALPILLAILPFPEIDAFEPVGLSYLLVGALAVGALIRQATERRWPALTAPVVLLSAFGLMVALDAVPLVSGLDGDAALDATSRALNVTAGVVTFLVVASSLRDVRLGPYLVVAVGGMALAGVITAIYVQTGSLGPLSTVHLIAIPDEIVLARASGPFTNPNYAGAFMAAGIVLAIGLLRIRGGMRLIALLALGPIAAALLLSFSRGALVAAAAGILLTIWFASRRVAVGAAVFVVVIGVLVYPLVLQTRYERSGGFATVRAVERVRESDEMRLKASLSSFDLWAKEPIIGIGGGQFPHRSPRVLEETTVTYPHNEYFAVLAEHGLIGATLLGAGVVAVLLRLRRRSGYVRPVALAVVATLGVSAGFTQPLGNFQVLGIGWVLLGMAAAQAATGPGTTASLLRRVRA